MNRTCLFICIIATFTTGCRKKDKTNPEPEKELPRISAIVHVNGNHSDTSFYHYDSQGRCIAYETPEQTGEITYSGHIATEHITWWLGGRLHGRQYRKERLVYYMQQGMQPDSVQYILLSGDKEYHTSTWVMTYDREGTLHWNHWYSGGSIVFAFIYTWQNGNLIESTPVVPATHMGPVPATRITYDESKPNTLKINRPQNEWTPSYLSDKLPVKTEEIFSSPATIRTDNYSYEYDEDGKVVRQIVSGNSGNYEYRYIYEK